MKYKTTKTHPVLKEGFIIENLRVKIEGEDIKIKKATFERWKKEGFIEETEPEMYSFSRDDLESVLSQSDLKILIEKYYRTPTSKELFTIENQRKLLEFFAKDLNSALEIDVALNYITKDYIEVMIKEFNNL
jgi:hypothetical protein